MNWGVIGYGEIAPSFIQALLSVEGQEIKSIASKSSYRSLLNRGLYGEVKLLQDYEEVYRDPDIDIVYICLTNNLHKENVISALKSNKHVLCEKPLGVSKVDTEEMVLLSKKKGLFLMEGMWTRFLPAYRYFVETLESNFLGEISLVKCDFGFNSDWGDKRRLKNRELFGGTLLDNADYNLYLAQDVFRRKPLMTSAFARYAKTGVEDMCGIMLQYPGGAMAQLFSSFAQETKQEAIIYGERGYIKLDNFWQCRRVESFIEGEKFVKEFPFRENGFEYEIEEVVSCIVKRKIESNVVSHKMSLEVAEIMDEIIEQVRR